MTQIAERKLLHVRLPRELHEELIAKAVEQEVSLNALIAALLAGAIRFNLKDSSPAKPADRTPADKLADALDSAQPGDTLDLRGGIAEVRPAPAKRADR
jgi:hypothetical protein